MFNSVTKTVLITGASGNLGSKLRRHLQGRYTLRLLDRKPKGKLPIALTDLSTWDEAWVDLFQGVDIVVHLAANAIAHRRWPALIGPNIDATINVFATAAEAKVKRVVYASSCGHVMGGYRHSRQPERLTTDLPVRPGVHWVEAGRPRDSIPYAATKLMGERLGKCYAEIYGMSVIVVRIGVVAPGRNLAARIGEETEPWFQMGWLSNRDYCQLMTCCIEADPSIRFAVVNGVSANTGMRWDIAYAREFLGYEPVDDVTRCEDEDSPAV
jgi:NAD+ dependent glucose-6-phosphate dehydrogenase